MPFNVSTTMYDFLRRLRSSGDNCTLLPEFRPVRFYHDTHIWHLLYNVFFCQGICCFLTGPFVLFTAGIFDTFTAASLFITLTDSPSIHRIFRRGTDPPSNFYIHNYLFEFTHMGRNNDNLFYNVSCGIFRMRFCIFGIDTMANCDTYSNLDFISFIWQNLERFDFVKYATTLVHRDYHSLNYYV
jgi:hypothetical protein